MRGQIYRAKTVTKSVIYEVKSEHKIRSGAFLSHTFRFGAWKKSNIHGIGNDIHINIFCRQGLTVFQENNINQNKFSMFHFSPITAKKWCIEVGETNFLSKYIIQT